MSLSEPCHSLMALLSPQALGSVLAYLTDAKRKLRHVVWVNLREEAVLECDGHTHSLRCPGPPMASDQLEVRHPPSAFCTCLPRRPSGKLAWEDLQKVPCPSCKLEKLRPQEEQTQGVTESGLPLWLSPWLSVGPLRLRKGQGCTQ